MIRSSFTPTRDYAQTNDPDPNIESFDHGFTDLIGNDAFRAI
jgi:hypothetical protein